MSVPLPYSADLQVAAGAGDHVRQAFQHARGAVVQREPGGPADSDPEFVRHEFPFHLGVQSLSLRSRRRGEELDRYVVGEFDFEHDDLPEDSVWFGFDYGGAADIVPNQRVEEVSDAIISSFAAIAGKTLNSMPRSYKSFEYAESQAEALAAYLCERFLLNGGRQ